MAELYEWYTDLTGLTGWEIIGLVVLAGVILAGMDVRHRMKKKSDHE